jgi:hypothetical protein
MQLKKHKKMNHYFKTQIQFNKNNYWKWIKKLGVYGSSPHV